MTELSQLYGSMDDNMSSRIDDIPEPPQNQKHEYNNEYHNEAPPKKVKKVQHVPQQIVHEIPSVEKFSNHSKSFEPETLQEYVPQRVPQYSFWDRMAIKRSEVIKLAIFSLVIVLGIALDRIGTHYITKYLSDNILTDFQEFMLRLSYPIMIFLILWIIKSM